MGLLDGLYVKSVDDTLIPSILIGWKTYLRYARQKWIFLVPLTKICKMTPYGTIWRLPLNHDISIQTRSFDTATRWILSFIVYWRKPCMGSTARNRFFSFIFVSHRPSEVFFCTVSAPTYDLVSLPRGHSCLLLYNGALVLVKSSRLSPWISIGIGLLMEISMSHQKIRRTDFREF